MARNTIKGRDRDTIKKFLKKCKLMAAKISILLESINENVGLNNGFRAQKSQFKFW